MPYLVGWAIGASIVYGLLLLLEQWLKRWQWNRMTLEERLIHNVPYTFGKSSHGKR